MLPSLRYPSRSRSRSHTQPMQLGLVEQSGARRIYHQPSIRLLARPAPYGHHPPSARLFSPCCSTNTPGPSVSRWPAWHSPSTAPSSASKARRTPPSSGSHTGSSGLSSRCASPSWIWSSLRGFRCGLRSSSASSSCASHFRARTSAPGARPHFPFAAVARQRVFTFSGHAPTCSQALQPGFLDLAATLYHKKLECLMASSAPAIDERLTLIGAGWKA